jgi:hypothetical protein
MIDQSIPVLLQLKHNGHDALCVAKLIGEPGRLFAKPVRPTQAAQPYRPKMIRLDERNLELVQGKSLGKPIYEYRGYVLVP